MVPAFAKEGQAAAPMTPTLASRLTADVPAAIATIAVRGPFALTTVLTRARLATRQPLLGKIYYGTWEFGDSNLREQIVVCRTHEDTLELHCHGGPAVCRAMLADLEAAGCRLVPASSWEMLDEPDAAGDALRRAAEQDLVQAVTDQAAAILLDQRNGALSAVVAELLEDLEHGRVPQAVQRVEAVLRWQKLGLHLVQPWRVVLAGPPNAGKSSLINAIAGRATSIVHHEPGTTRDWVEARTAIDGWPVALTDTAGVRESHDAIEQAGVRQALARIREADLLVLVIDATHGWTTVHAELERLAAEQQLACLRVWNKVDLKQSAERLANDSPAGMKTSALAATGIQELIGELARQLVPTRPPPGEAIPFRAWQVTCLEAFADALRQGQPAAARQSLQQIFCEPARDAN